MHELSLFAHVPNDNLSQIIRALTAITGMSPRPLLEHHLLFKPKRQRTSIGSGPVPSAGASGISNTDLYFLKLVADVYEAERDYTTKLASIKPTTTTNEDDPTNTTPTTTTNETDDEKRKKEQEDLLKQIQYDYKKQKWTIKFADLPEVSGKRPVTSRLILNADIGEGDALAFINSLGYTMEQECVVSGWFFTKDDIYITLTRVMMPKNTFEPFPASSLTPLDPCDSSILQAAVRVVSANEQDSMTKGVEELKTLKAEMKGLVDLEVGDRLSLDTRVR